MKQAVSIQRAKNKRYAHVPFNLIRDARGGDIKAMTMIQQLYDPYIRCLATVNFCGRTYLNTELYERLKLRLVIATMKFKLFKKP